MIHAVAVDIGSARKAIPETAKTFSFVGDGTAVEVKIYCTSVGIGKIPRLISLHQEPKWLFFIIVSGRYRQR